MASTLFGETLPRRLQNPNILFQRCSFNIRGLSFDTDAHCLIKLNTQNEGFLRIDLDQMFALTVQMTDLTPNKNAPALARTGRFATELGD